jgi:hypothetical protein
MRLWILGPVVYPGLTSTFARGFTSSRHSGSKTSQPLCIGARRAIVGKAPGERTRESGERAGRLIREAYPMAGGLAL